MAGRMAEGPARVVIAQTGAQGTRPQTAETQGPCPDLRGTVWADLEWPQIYHLSFYILAVGPKNTKCPRMGLRIGLRGLFLVQPALFFEPGPTTGLPGPNVGPKGPKIGRKPGAGFIILSSLRSAPIGPYWRPIGALS